MSSGTLSQGDGRDERHEGRGKKGGKEMKIGQCERSDGVETETREGVKRKEYHGKQ